MKKSFIVLAFAGMAVLFSGCAKVPQQELDGANNALASALSAEANVYLQPEYNALVDSMHVINAEIEMNNGKLFKSFADVKVKLTNIEQQANDLVASTEAKKVQIKDEVTANLVQLDELLNANALLVEKAPKGKEGKAAIEAIKGELEVVKSAGMEVTQLLESNNLLGAQSKLNAAIEKATALNVELTTVVEKYAQKNK
ncbi:MAG: hypothetical protein JW729_01535 [Bacteroidales bacterium]|nr:hypothetical protein [Bacteroidales bacterium]